MKLAIFDIPPDAKTDKNMSNSPSTSPATKLPPTRERITVKRYHQLFLPSDAFSKNDIDEMDDDIVFTPIQDNLFLYLYNILLMGRLLGDK